MDKNIDIFSSWIVEKYIAHRGLHNSFVPENSLKAFQNAIDNNYAIELDVQLTLDNKVVVFHDSSISRMTGKSGYIKNLTYEDLKDITLLNSSEKIPLLSQVLSFVDGKVPLLIEIKNADKVGELEKQILSLIKNYHGEFAVQSFNPFSLAYFKENAPHILRGQLSCFFKGEKLSFFKKFALKRLILCKYSSPDFISYCSKNLPNRFVKKYSKLPLIAWCIKSEQEYMKVIKHCDNIIFEGFTPVI